jgi:phosphatidylserine/phosphatidylglycerophosphate/cardiolipin synthase-like enzyme
MRAVLSIFHVAVVIGLSFLAKDKVLILWQDFVNPKTATSSKIIPVAAPSIEVNFSPNGGATQAIVKAIAAAKSSIIVAAYSFTSKDLAEALLAAKKRNIAIKIILDRSQASQRYSSATFFSNMGFDLRIDVKHKLYHNKFIVIDDRTVITGSFNFTKAAEDKNAENMLIIRNNPDLARQYTRNFSNHWRLSISRQEFLAKAAQ